MFFHIATISQFSRHPNFAEIAINSVLTTQSLIVSLSQIILKLVN